jgi:hypothetical protein
MTVSSDFRAVIAMGVFAAFDLGLVPAAQCG